MSAAIRSRHAGIAVSFALVLGAWRSPSAHAQREPARPEARGVVKSLDAAAGTLTVAVGDGRQATVDKTFQLPPGVEVAVGSGGARGAAFREGKLADLAAGVSVSLALSADQQQVESILAEEPFVRGVLTAVNQASGTLTVSHSGAREQPPQVTSYTLAPDAEIAIDDGRGRRFSLREGRLADLVQGAQIIASLSLDRKQVQSLVAEGPTLAGTIKAVNPAAHSVTLTTRPPRRADAGEERILTVAGDAGVLLDDGLGKRLSVKRGKLEDLPVGSAVVARLSVDQSAVTLIRAEGPSLFGQLKSLDAAKGVLTLSIPKGRGENPEEKMLEVGKGARILLDGNAVQLANLPAGGDAIQVQVQLSLDQKTARTIQVRQFRGR